MRHARLALSLIPVAGALSIAVSSAQAAPAKGNCTRGGAGAGSLAGTNKVLRTINAGLRVH